MDLPPLVSSFRCDIIINRLIHYSLVNAFEISMTFAYDAMTWVVGSGYYVRRPSLRINPIATGIVSGRAA